MTHKLGNILASLVALDYEEFSMPSLSTLLASNCLVPIPVAGC